MSARLEWMDAAVLSWELHPPGEPANDGQVAEAGGWTLELGSNEDGAAIEGSLQMIHRKLTAMLAQVRKQLEVEGEPAPCPLCGSTHAPACDRAPGSPRV